MVDHNSKEVEDMVEVEGVGWNDTVKNMRSPRCNRNTMFR